LFIFERDYDWRGLIAATGPGGVRWVEMYNREAKEIRAAISESAAAIRRLQLDQSRSFLDQAEGQRRRMEQRKPSLFHILGRFYFGGLAYYYHRREEFELADQAMVQAEDSIRAALEEEACLLPFAAVGLDIPLKRARIARAQSRWSEMRTHANVVRETASDRIPLCMLFGRVPVHHSMIVDQLAARQDIAESLLPAVRYLSSRQLREEFAAKLLAPLFLPADFLIEYP
jgi:hypothetical protein